MRIAAGYSDGTLRIFRLVSTEMEMKLHPHQVAVTAIQYSANGEKEIAIFFLHPTKMYVFSHQDSSQSDLKVQG